MGLPHRSEARSWTPLLRGVCGTCLHRQPGDSHHNCEGKRSNSQAKIQLFLSVPLACHFGKVPGRLPKCLFLVFLSGLPLFLDYLCLQLGHEFRNRFALLRPLLGFLWLSPSIISSTHSYTSVFPKLLLLLGSQQLSYSFLPPCPMPLLLPEFRQ